MRLDAAGWFLVVLASVVCATSWLLDWPAKAVEISVAVFVVGLIVVASAAYRHSLHDGMTVARSIAASCREAWAWVMTVF